MSHSFNLVKQPFIPVVLPDGKTKELGLRDTLVRASEIREVHDPSPLATIALQRLLLAVLHRVFGPKSRAAWQTLWQARSFEAAALDAYFERWRERFDLFHEQYPFYQKAGFQTKQPSSLTRLAHELTSGNNATLFDHTCDEPATPLTSAQAARLVITQQAFAVGGGKSETGYTAHAPLLQGAAVFVQGRCLFETLMLNLVPCDDDRPMPAMGDLPAWEHDHPFDKERTRPAGYLDYLTWQSRTMRLHPETLEGKTVVRSVSFAQGHKFEAPELYDPMFAYRRSEKEGDRSVRLSESRSLWRDSGALFHIQDVGVDTRPGVLHEIEIHARDGVIPRCQLHNLSVFGVCTDKAKIHFWRHERMPLPLSYLDSKELVKKLEVALETAEKIALALRDAVKLFAGTMLSPDGRPDSKRVQAVTDELGAEALYWSRLELPFRSFLVTLAASDEDDEREHELARWVCGVLVQQARKSFEETVGQLDQTARILRAQVSGQRRLNADLKRLSNPFSEVLHEQRQTQ